MAPSKWNYCKRRTGLGWHFRHRNRFFVLIVYVLLIQVFLEVSYNSFPIIQDDECVRILFQN